MQTAPADLWDPAAQLNHDAPLPRPPPPPSRPSRVTAAPPAKRITFYRRGGSPFSGVRMAVDKRSFKCFDALLDDLSQKVPLPFGVRTVTTPRGTHSIRALEQLEDGGCYLCSDRPRPRPGPPAWPPQGPPRPGAGPPAAQRQRQEPRRPRRRVLLVKNSEPAVRRNLALGRRTPSLRGLLDQASALLHCPVRTLYTAQGRKIDSVQSLEACPGVLVCAGREPFRPLLGELRKGSDERLPGLGAGSPSGERSRTSPCSEGHDSKKSVNFGLETRKSIIHPRCDSSARSARYSLSSEKSLPNSCYHVRGAAIHNDDIQKRVVVNRDGSLSVEMRVRFHLHHDQTVQWSTRIKKTPAASLANGCCPLGEMPPQHLQSESCSDLPGSASCPEAAECKAPPPHGPPEAGRCPCYERQRHPDRHYDLWENPAHSSNALEASQHGHASVRHTHSSSSSSSSCHSRRMVRRRARGRAGDPGTSLQEEMCCVMEEVVEERRGGDGGRVEVCTVSRCCSRSKLASTADLRPHSCRSEEESEQRSKSKTAEPAMSEGDDERPLHDSPLTPRPPSSHTSSSSACSAHSAKRRKHSHGASPKPATTATPQDETMGEGESGQSGRTCEHRTAISGESVSRNSDTPHGSRRSQQEDTTSPPVATCLSVGAGDDDEEGEEGERVGERSDVPAVSQRSTQTHHTARGCSQRSSRSQTTPLGPAKASPPELQEEEEKKTETIEETERAASTMSAKSNASVKSTRSLKSPCDSSVRAPSAIEMTGGDERGGDKYGGDKDGGEDRVEERTASSASAKSDTFTKTSASTSAVCPCHKEADVTAGAEKGAEPAKRAASSASAKSKALNADRGEDGVEGAANNVSEGRAQSGLSVASRASRSGRASSPRAASPRATRAPELSLCMPRLSAQEDTDRGPGEAEDRGPGGEEDRGPGSMSVCSKASAGSRRSARRHCGLPSSPRAPQEDEEEEEKDVVEKEGEQSESTQSAVSKWSHRSVRESQSGNGTSERVLSRASTASVSIRLSGEEQEQEVEDSEGGSDSRKSSSADHERQAKTPNGPKTLNGHKTPSSPKTPNGPKTPSSTKEKEVSSTEDKAASATSVKNKTSVKSTTSQKASCNGRNIPVIETSGAANEGPEQTDGDEEKRQERTASAMSAKSNGSVKSFKSHKSSCNGSVKAVSPKPVLSPKQRYASPSPSVTENDLETGGVKNTTTVKTKSTAGSQLDTAETRALSVMSSTSASRARSKSPLRDLQASPKPTNHETSETGDSASKVASGLASQGKGQTADITGKASDVHSKTPNCLRPESAASARSGSKTRGQAVSTVALEESKSGASLLGVNGHKAGSGAGGVDRSFWSAKTTSKSESKEVRKVTNSRSSSALPSQPASPGPSNNNDSKPALVLDNSSESALSHSLSAADLLRETLASPRPQSSASGRSSRKARSELTGRSRKSRKCKEEEAVESKLTPDCLPNASASEVVSDWLMSIPTESCMCVPGDGLNGGGEEMEERGEEKAGKETDEGKEQAPENLPGTEQEQQEVMRAEEKPQDENDVPGSKVKEEESTPPVTDLAPSHPTSLFHGSHSLHRNCHSAITVMKVLLSPSLERSHSLPEVSPVYGRRLSSSAKGLLDCLARLQLIDPLVTPDDSKEGRGQRYSELMATLHSLWLTEPQGGGEEEEGKGKGKHQVSPPRSSSGVDVNSGSGGSRRSRGSGVGGAQTTTDKTETPTERITPGPEKGGGGEGEGGERETETSADHATPLERGGVPKNETPPSSSSNDKSTAYKSPTDTERGTTPEDTAGSSMAQRAAPVGQRASMDPDPVWVLSLLKKLEHQFMSHYVSAMAEFKVRWDLDDSALLDTMIAELRDEVGRRIQGSVERELKKIQGRAGTGAGGRGRSPRPPLGGVLSRDSTITEQRRRRLQGMKNMGPNTNQGSLSDGDATSGGELSDQRSDDDYCPCETCVRKKMAARPIKATRAAVVPPPMMMEFDLRKILQRKREPQPTAPPGPMELKGKDSPEEEGGNLEAVQEVEEEEEKEEEEIKADIIHSVIIQENIHTIPEEEEEEEKEEKGETEAEEVEGEKVGVEEEEEKKTESAKEEDGDEDGGTDGTEDEKERENVEENTGVGMGGEEMKEVDGEKAGGGDTVAEDTGGETSAAEREDEGEETERESGEDEAEGETEGGETEGGDTEGGETEGGETEGMAAKVLENKEEEEGEDGEDEEALEGEGPEDPEVRVAEGDEADSEDSDTSGQRHSNTSEDQSGEEGGIAGEEEEEEEEDAAEETERESVVEDKQKGGGAEVGVVQQLTRTSVEGQSGSTEVADPEPKSPVSPPIPSWSPEPGSHGPTAAPAGEGAGRKGQSHSPARAKRHAPRDSGLGPDELEL